METDKLVALSVHFTPLPCQCFVLRVFLKSSSYIDEVTVQASLRYDWYSYNGHLEIYSSTSHTVQR